MKRKIYNIISISFVITILVMVGSNISYAQTTGNDYSGQTSGTVTGNDYSGQTSNKTTSNNTGISTISNPIKVDSIGELVKTAAEVFSYIVVLFGVLALVWTGLQYILARGNPEKMKEQTQRLMWIVIGIAIVIGARIIISVVINTLSATGTVDSNIINSAQNALKK